MKRILTIPAITIFCLYACTTPQAQSTIDNQLQDIAANSLKGQLIMQDADYGTVIITEVATGEVKALVNLDCQADSTVIASRMNYATDWLYEPGSTFKIASYIALLENGVSPDMTVDCENGKAMINGVMVADDHSEGEISLRDALCYSMNIGIAKAVYSTFNADPDRYMNCVQILFPDIDSVKRAEFPTQPNLVKVAYGYGVKVTPMHVIALYNAIANNGKYISPTLVTRKPEQGKAICSDEILSEVNAVLSENLDGLFKKQNARGYCSTTQLSYDNGEYVDEQGGRQYYACAVGSFPADNPRYSVFVGIKTYYGNSRFHTYYGAGLAMPVFTQIADALKSE